MTPPRLASWLLVRLVRDRDPLLGDLREEWAAGRGRLWYWRQVATAIALGSIKDVRGHLVLTGRALALGTLFVWWAGFLDAVVARVLHPGVPLSWHLFASPPYFKAFDLLQHYVPTPPGLATWDFEYQAAVAVASRVGVVTIVGAIGGWLVALLHRPLQGPMVVAYAAAFSAFGLVWWGLSASSFSYLLLTIEQTGGSTITPWRVSWALFVSALDLSMFWGGILVGGALAPSPRTSETAVP